MTKIPSFRKSPPAEPSASATEFLEGSPLMGRQDEQAATQGESQRRTAPLSVADDTVYRTVNVKLNKRRYTSFKLLSALTETPMQQYLVEMVDELLERNSARLSPLKDR